MAYQDQVLKCKECGNEFTWTASEQEFYAQKGFQNAPQRCPSCRQARKQQLRGNRQMHTAVCAQCGKECEVPFEPRGDKPVYCNECYQQHKNG
ncbi:zinc-binding protein [Candidatus Microgenomates bacterium]|jgi:CxxC-x17-CxxC domain-containing protein|nr:MAG: zinc-binding protein [Candidatus Microgenomates bacterium]